MITDSTNTISPFWSNHIDFYIFLGLALIGIGYSMASFVQARKAKINSAIQGNTVKAQSIIMEIIEITNLCHLNLNIDSSEARTKFADISARIRKIISIYRDDIMQENDQLIERIETSLVNIRLAINSVNPAEIVESMTYYTIEPSFTEFAGNINDLRGILEKKLINR